MAKEANIQILERDWIDVEIGLTILDDDKSDGSDIMAGMTNMVENMQK